MSSIIHNGSTLDEERRGWRMPCPSCGDHVRYTVLNVIPGEDVFLYSDTTSDFVLRDEDANAAREIGDDAGTQISELAKLYARLERILPASPKGEHFRIWSNVKCPTCSYEFPYNDGIRDEEMRFTESAIVWIEGATAFRGGNQPSNRLVEVIAD